MQNMIQLPQDLYDAVHKKAAAQQKTIDTLVTEWISEHLDESETSEITQAFEQEVAAFEQVHADLLTQYAGQFVAIYQGKVVASGSEKLALLDKVRGQYGNVVCYIEKAASNSPRTVRMPSACVARS